MFTHFFIDRPILSAVISILIFLGGAVARPSTVSSDLYNEVSTAYFTAVNEILTGQASDAAARVAQLQTDLEGIMADL